MRTLVLVMVSIAPFFLAMASVDGGGSGPEQKPADPAERLIHRRDAAGRAGVPAEAKGRESGVLSVSVLDRETGRPAHCRVNVIGSDGDYYEPASNPLSPWSLHRLGNRVGKGPFRYYGWFFYSDGRFEVRVPAGEVSVEVWKGYEYAPVVSKTHVAAGRTTSLEIELHSTAPMKPLGYYSGDTHLHLDRNTDEDDERALDLLQAEDLQYGYALCMNDPPSYTGTMQRQTWRQAKGLGPSSVRRRGDTLLMSGQEYRCGTFGHICFLGHDRLVLENEAVDPNNWPTFGLLGKQVAESGGVSFHAHGGYGREIYADYVQQATSGVELLQFAEYRGVSLQGWYHILNAGFRFPAVGASDFPYCRVLGDCRTYVRCDHAPGANEWLQQAAEGKSFFTTGPLLLFEVDGRGPGDTLELPAPATVQASLKLRCEITPVDRVQFLANGRVVFERNIEPQEAQRGWMEWTQPIRVTEPTWLAARAWSQVQENLPDAEAHTNPVYVRIGGRDPFHAEDVKWLLERLDERIDFHRRRNFTEKQRVLDYFETSRKLLVEKLQSRPMERTQN